MSPSGSRGARLSRSGARAIIVATANRHSTGTTKPYSQKSLQRAVFVVRNRKLVDEKVLVAAGFNAVRAR